MMSHPIRSLVVLGALLCPTVILSGLAGYAAWSKSQAPSFILPIRGYDPRDLIHGHYLQFQIAWPWTKTDAFSCHTDTLQDCRVCLQRDTTSPNQTKIRIVQADQTASCDATLDGIDYFYQNQRATPITDPVLSLRNAPHRFFVDERYGPALDAVFRKNPHIFAIAVKVHDHKMFLETLLIDGVDYRAYFKKHKDAVDSAAATPPPVAADAAQEPTDDTSQESLDAPQPPHADNVTDNMVIDTDATEPVLQPSTPPFTSPAP